MQISQVLTRQKCSQALRNLRKLDLTRQHSGGERDRRLRSRAHGLEGAGDGVGGWRCVARKGRQRPVVRAARRGKSHLAAALGLALVENGWRVLFTRTTDLVQRSSVKNSQPFDLSF